MLHSAFMRNTCVLSLLFLTFVDPLCRAELSTDQKLLDFQNLAAAFSKHYAFYEWKRSAVHFDGLAARV